MDRYLGEEGPRDLRPRQSLTLDPCQIERPPSSPRVWTPPGLQEDGGWTHLGPFAEAPRCYLTPSCSGAGTTRLELGGPSQGRPSVSAGSGMCRSAGGRIPTGTPQHPPRELRAEPSPPSRAPRPLPPPLPSLEVPHHGHHGGGGAAARPSPAKSCSCPGAGCRVQGKRGGSACCWQTSLLHLLLINLLPSLRRAVPGERKSSDHRPDDHRAAPTLHLPDGKTSLACRPTRAPRRSGPETRVWTPKSVFDLSKQLKSSFPRM